MRSFIIAAALAVTGAAGFASKADAQFYLNTFTPGGGLVISAGTGFYPGLYAGGLYPAYYAEYKSGTVSTFLGTGETHGLDGKKLGEAKATEKAKRTPAQGRVDVFRGRAHHRNFCVMDQHRAIRGNRGQVTTIHQID